MRQLTNLWFWKTGIKLIFPINAKVLWMLRKISLFLKRLLGSVCLIFLLVACAQVVEPQKEPIDPDKVVKVRVKAAMEYLRMSDFANARRHLVYAQEAKKRSAEVESSFGLLYSKAGDFELADKHFSQAVKYEPANSKVRNNYGAFLFSRGRYKDAIKQLRKAAEDPAYDKRAIAYENVGNCALHLDDIDVAKNAFEKAIKLDPMISRSYLELAEISYSQEDWKRAKHYLQGFSERAKSTARSLWLGIRIARVLRDKNALSSYELALRQLFPESEEYRQYLESLTLKSLE